MAPRRATLLCYGDDDVCSRTRKFIEDAGVLVDVRDISKEPLSEDEIRELIGNLEVRHFLNVLSPSFEGHRLDERRQNREEVIKLLAADHTLLRRPIVRSARLLTIGADTSRIAEMLQIGNGQAETPRAETHRGNSRRPARAGQSA
jgi:arsenate reductase-like glutaredoxin family protein